MENTISKDMFIRVAKLFEHSEIEIEKLVREKAMEGILFIRFKEIEFI